MQVRVPASSANLGPGFDALGMAVTLHATIGVVAGDAGEGRTLDEYHPATKAFRRAGGEGTLWARSPIPVGRGLGFSGAMRVGGVVAAVAQRVGPDPERVAAERDWMLAIAAELEGHGDNVAASLLGGVVATAGGHAVRVPLAIEPAVVMWVPRATTSTSESRTRLASTVAFDDAVFNVGRTALLVAALAAGEVAALRRATEDRLHQQARLAAAAPSAATLEAGLEAGAWCGWLSGSGPSVALLCDPGVADDLATALPEGGTVLRLGIDGEGAVVLADT